MCRSRPWPKPPSTPTGRWRSRCPAAISAKASPASWKSGRRGLRGSDSEKVWWSQAGSNRRPRHCERRALPAELWPHRDRVEKCDGGQQLAPFTIRAKVKSRTAKSRFSEGFVPNFPCLGGGGTDIYRVVESATEPPASKPAMRAVLDIVL